MTKDNFLTWLKYAGIRAFKTVIQTAVSYIGISTFIDEVDWIKVASTAALAGVLSLLTSLGGLPEGKEDKEND